VAASRVGSATDRDSLSTRHADGSPVLVEEDAAAMAELLLARLVCPRSAAARSMATSLPPPPRPFVGAGRGVRAGCGGERRTRQAGGRGGGGEGIVS
jgi:hypothetical protein